MAARLRNILVISRSVGALSACAVMAITVPALPATAGSFDMSTLNPLYQTVDGAFHPGVSPNYSASSTATSVTLIGQPNLPNDLGQYENTNPLTTGDFTASATLTISANSGGFFNVTTGTGYFGLNRNDFGVWGNYGVGFGNVNTPTIPVPSTTICTPSLVSETYSTPMLHLGAPTSTCSR